MAHPFPLKVVALQAGVSLATVDRVLKQRGGVRGHTARRVTQALAELARQSEQVGLAGRKFMLDVVMVAPQRFSAPCAARSRPSCRRCSRPCCARASTCTRPCRPTPWPRCSIASEKTPATA